MDERGGASVPESLRGYKLDAMMEQVQFMMDIGCEPTSALKQAASDGGIAFETQAMGDFVAWGLAQMGCSK